MALERRTVLKAAGAAAVLASPLAFLFRREARADGWPLIADPARIIDLPPGFSYSILERTFDTMDDGFKVPGRPDGMACFSGPGDTLILMRNHELDRSRWDSGYDASPREAYDPYAMGGVTRLVLNAKTLQRISSNRVLAGTLRNCAGGSSPWGWLSCEESVDKGHGYVFRCRTDAARVAPAERIAGYGRFNHEAACVDPKTLTAYLTEDRPDSCLYRYRPQDLARPHTSGKLQALRVIGAPGLNLSRDVEHGIKLKVDWVDIPNPDPKDDSVRAQGAAAGAARFFRGEGIVMTEGMAYVCCTSGGRQSSGQVFKLSLGGADGQDKIELFAESPGSPVLDMPDNIYMSPWGDLLVAEDGSGEQFLRGITAEGRVYTLAKNAKSSGEFAGVCMSPTGKALFVNMQLEGLTLVVSGPFGDLTRRAKHLARRPA